MVAKDRWVVVILATVLVLILNGGAGQALAPAPVAGTTTYPPAAAAPGWVPPISPDVRVSAESAEAERPDAAYNTQYDEYLVVWSGAKSIWGRRVTGRGEPVGGIFQIAPSATYGVSPPKIAYDSRRNRYLVLWGRLSGTVFDLYGRFIQWDGPNPALAAFAIDATKPAATSVHALAYGYTADEYLVVWATESAQPPRTVIAGRRVEADGSGFAAGAFVVTAHNTDFRQNPDVAYNLHRNEYLVTCDDKPKVNDNVYGVRLAGSGAKLGGGEFPIANWPDEEAEASVAACHTSDQYLVAWHSIQGLKDGLYARFVDGDGNPGQVKELVHYDWWAGYRPLDVACGVTNLPLEDPHYLVSWSKEPLFHSAAHAREVMPNGATSDAVEIATSSQAVAVAGGAINHLVAFESGPAQVHARIVGNTRPRALFGVTPSDGPSTTLFQFDASASSDATDAPAQLQVRWDWQNDGTWDTTWSHDRTAGHRFALASWQGLSIFLVRLQVTDGHGASDETTGQVTVRNAPPSAAFSVDPSGGDTNTPFHFNAASSSDPEGGALEVRWDWQDDGTYDTAWSAEAAATHAFAAPGTYTVRLQVQDSFEQMAEATRQVTVEPASANTPPVASFTVMPPSGDTSTIFAFDASGSTDAEDGTPAEVRWDWDDDGIFEVSWSTATTASNTFATAGTYTVRLEVRDSGGLTATAAQAVPVSQQVPQHRAYLPLLSRSSP